MIRAPRQDQPQLCMIVLDDTLYTEEKVAVLAEWLEFTKSLLSMAAVGMPLFSTWSHLGR